MNKKLIHILVVDDHPIVREGIKATLNTQLDIKVVGEAGNGLEAVEMSARLNPNVIILDFSMPKMNGLKTANILSKVQPQCEIVVLLTQDQSESFSSFHELGVKGFLLKDGLPSEIISAVRSILQGNKFFGKGIELGLFRNTAKIVEILSKREQEVLQLIAISSRNKDIAEKLEISVRTVEKHRSQIMKKLNIDNVAGLTRYALNCET